MGNCEKDFRSRNQLHRHLASVHHLVLTKKDTYVQAIKSRSCFLLVTTPLSKFGRNFASLPLTSLARKPCTEFDHEACEKRAKDDYSAEAIRNLTRKKSARSSNKADDVLVKKIVSFNESLCESAQNVLTNQMKRRLPIVSLPICSAKVKRVNWLEQPDAVMYIVTEKTLKLRNVLPVPQQRKCGRRPNILAMPDMGKG